MAKGYRQAPGKGGGNMQHLLAQAQKMQKEAERVQSEIQAMVVDASAGGGVVTVEMNGKHELVGVKIDPSAVDPDDVDMLQDLILAACNEANRMVEEISAEKMGKVTGGMNLPF